MNSLKRVVFFFVFALSFVGVARPEVKVSVLTCSPGDEAYSLYGHTALRYVDTARNVDVVFNYGCFDFSTPNFGWRFVLGETDYMVGCTDFENFLPEYALRGSAVVEQVIDLSEEEARALFRALLLNIRPENRVYRYRYLDNNCTTKVRDMLLEVLADGGDVVYSDSVHAGMTYRDALALPSMEHPWYTFGINLLLGAGVDNSLDSMTAQFLPLDYMNALEGMSIVAADGAVRRVVVATNILLPENKVAVVRSNFTPFNAFLLLLLATLVAMLCELRKRKTWWGVDMLLMSVQGLAGALLLFMALFSEHPAVDVNWLIVLLNPLALVLMPVYVYRIRKHKSMNIAWVQVAFVALFVLTALLGLQVYPAPIFFCAMALLVRSLFHIYKDRICDLNIV